MGPSGEVKWSSLDSAPRWQALPASLSILAIRHLRRCGRTRTSAGTRPVWNPCLHIDFLAITTIYLLSLGTIRSRAMRKREKCRKCKRKVETETTSNLEFRGRGRDLHGQKADIILRSTLGREQLVEERKRLDVATHSHLIDPRQNR